jgi:DNA polymerase-1
MKKRGMKSKMLLQVHDELLFEVVPDETEEMQKLIPGIMTSAMELSIPLKVDINTGHNWAELKQ